MCEDSTSVHKSQSPANKIHTISLSYKLVIKKSNYYCTIRFSIVPLQRISKPKHMEAAEYLLKLSTFTLIGIDVLILIICIIGTRVAFLKRQLTDLRIKMAINQREEACRYQLLIKQIQQQKGNNALDDLQHLFFP